MTTGFNVKDALHKTPHNGIDLALPENTPLYSIGKGVVESVVNYGKENIGKGVIVKLDSGERVIYGHINDAAVKAGDVVKSGDLLAYSGNTGRSTGPHLHFTVKENGEAVDPSSVIEKAVEQHSESWWSNNPFTRAKESIDSTAQSIGEFNSKLDSIGEWLKYWLNPVNLGNEIWSGLDVLITSPDTAFFLIGATIIGGWLMMLGAKWPKKYLFWGWIIYWVLRGAVFV